jgi:hypothetical protein
VGSTYPWPAFAEVGSVFETRRPSRLAATDPSGVANHCVGAGPMHDESVYLTQSSGQQVAATTGRPYRLPPIRPWHGSRPSRLAASATPA